MNAQQQFEQLRAAFADRHHVSVPDKRGFGNGALCVNDRIFAMVSRDRLVVKLPARRVQDLIAAGQGEPFDAGKSRPMKEWLVLGPDAGWLALGHEALDFVASGR
jgi:TfoX N-terminal domain